MRQKRLVRLLLFLGLSLSVSIGFNCWPVFSQVPVAEAHAFVIGSDPVDGSTVQTLPAMLRIYFNENIGPASIAHIIEPDGRIVDGGRSTIPATKHRELDTPVQTPNLLPQGSYLVRWTATSNEDGHATSGAIGFNVGHSSFGLPGEVILGPSTSNYLPKLDGQGILGIAWEWLVLLALTFWVGILVIEGLVLESAVRPTVFAQTRKQAYPLQWLCLAALFVGELINLILRSTIYTQDIGNSGIDLFALRQLVFETSYGHLWLVRMALILSALGLCWWTTRQNDAGDGIAPVQAKLSGGHISRLRQQLAQEEGRAINSSEEDKNTQVEQNELVIPSRSRSAPARKYTLTWLVLAGLILLTLAPAGDVAQLSDLHISATVFTWLYLAASCIWLGGTAYLGFVLLPLLAIIEPDSSTETLAGLLRRYTPLTLGAIGVLVVSGLFLSEAAISNVQQLLTDPYGRALLVKIFLFLLMLVGGGYALFFLGPRLIRQVILLPVVNAELPARRTRQSALEQTERSLRRALKWQAWLGAGMLLCAALMSFFAPPIVFPRIDYGASTSTQPSTNALNTQTKLLGDLSVILEVWPGRLNYANTVIISIFDARGNPVTDAQVQVSTNMEAMDMGVAHVLINGGKPTYSATFDKNVAFSMAGVWDIVVWISRPHQRVLHGTFQVVLSA